jgi:glutaredoxin-related protein
MSSLLVSITGLKKLNDWPTFPQIIVNGELIGGLDILKVSTSQAARFLLEVLFTNDSRIHAGIG